ncbi:uncharacterized protein [Montipora capricornis]|uniref:uncharacterized protein n=1 Tax=Montipora capricornis TaxID=246305 RepID=UPI0035F1CFDB
MTTHILSCEKQLIPCSDCGIFTTREKLTHHLAELCSYTTISCPLGCGEIMPSCHVTLHLSQCGEKAVQCAVSGCHAIFRRKDNEKHVTTAASSHMVLQTGEVQQLRRIIFLKSFDKTPVIRLQEGSTSAFKWEVGQFRNYVNSTIASTCFVSAERHRWRGICENSALYIQLQSSVHPVTAKIRVVPLNGREEAVSVPITVIKEGEMVKAGSDNLTTSWFNNNLLKVKFIITSYNYE